MEHHPTQPVVIEIAGSGREDLQLVKLRGPLTINNFFEFQDLTRQPSDGRGLIIDLSEVPYIDSAALGCLIGLHVSCGRTGRKYALAAANDRLAKMFSLVGVDGFLVRYDSVGEAEAALA